MAVKLSRLRWYPVQLCAIKITNYFKIKRNPILLLFAVMRYVIKSDFSKWLHYLIGRLSTFALTSIRDFLISFLIVPCTTTGIICLSSTVLIWGMLQGHMRIFCNRFSLILRDCFVFPALRLGYHWDVGCGLESTLLAGDVLMWFIFINENGVGMKVGVEASMQIWTLIKHHHHTTLSAAPQIACVH